MTVSDRIGIDLGNVRTAPSLASAAVEVGASIVRLRFDLGTHTVVDESLLDEAAGAVDALRAVGLRVIGVVDSDLTVAPSGAGAFAEEGPESLARVWAEEMAGNAAALARHLGDRVMAWEILPEPNRRQDGEPRIAPARWAPLLDIVSRAIAEAAPECRRVAGGLVSDDDDDGVDYLRAALRRAPWPNADPPFDALAISLRILADGGPSESIVSATIAERAARIERATAQGDSRPELWVSAVGWDAVKAGESAQARNLWTAFDTLTTQAEVRSVVWTALVDRGHACGLFAGDRPDVDARRPAWQAFKDFALYAAQISPAVSLDAMLESDSEPEPGAEDVIEADLAAAAVIIGLEEESEETSEDSAASESASAEDSSEAEPLSTTEEQDDSADLTEGEWEAGEIIEGSAVLLQTDDSEEIVMADGTAEAHNAEAAGDDEGGTGGLAAAAAAAAVAAMRNDEDTNEGRTVEEPSEEEDLLDEAGALAAAAVAVGIAAARADEDADAGEIPEAADAEEARQANEDPLDNADGPRDPALESETVAMAEGLASPPAGIAAAAGIAAGLGADRAPDLVVLRVPSTEDLLRAQGLDEERLRAAQAALEARYGRHEGLPPGEYVMDLSQADEGASAAGPRPSNQDMLAAFYRAGGGTWTLLAQAGIPLRDLVIDRDAIYQGPEIEALPGLEREEREALRTALAG